jgi:hypothetical protein
MVFLILFPLNGGIFLSSEHSLVSDLFVHVEDHVLHVVKCDENDNSDDRVAVELL